MSEYHVPVLLKESVDGLDIRQGGVYLDLTFGGGGHSGEILRRLDAEGCLLGFDQDEDALANVPEDDRFIFVNHNFRYLRNFMRYYGYEEADGILADLGVSSHEFDEAGRGFSFRFEAELDMRMNQRSKLTAATVLNTYDAEQLTAIFRNYGEVENARRLVDLIVKARANQEIKTSEAFYQIILPCIPKLKEKKYLAKVYQALRIEVNGELEALEEMMQQAKHRYAGLILCKECGSPFVPMIRYWNGKRRVEYVCKGYHRNGKSYCSSHRIHEEVLDVAVQEFAQTMRIKMAEEQKELKQKQKMWALRKPILDAHIFALQKGIQELEQEIDGIIIEKIGATKTSSCIAN